MSQEAIQEFYSYVQNQPELQQELSALINNPEAMIDKAVNLAQRNNYSFTKAELEEAIASLEAAISGEIELSDEQLEAIAGGKRRNSSQDGYIGASYEGE